MSPKKKGKQSPLSGLAGGSLDLGALTGKLNTGAAPDLAALRAGPLEPVADPLAAVEYTGELDKDAAAELTDLEQAYRDRAKNEAGRFKNATDSEYWVAFCFRDRESKEKFLRDYGLMELGDKYIDGHRAAKVLPKP